jgi:hypothetical protein
MEPRCHVSQLSLQPGEAEAFTADLVAEVEHVRLPVEVEDADN